MLNDIVNITLYLYSSTTIVFVLMKSSQRRRLALTPALREKQNEQTNQPLLSSLCPLSPKNLYLLQGVSKVRSDFLFP